MSHLLVKPESAVGDFDIDAPRDYLPDPIMDWVVTIDFNKPVSRDAINSLLDIPWQTDHGLPTIYGFPSDGRYWTFVNAKDSPERFSKLKIAWSLWDSLDQQPKQITAEALQRFRRDAENKLENLGDYQSQVERPIEDSFTVIAALPALIADCDHDVTFKLIAPEGEKFPGRKFWDVMLCLGLDYGDGDLFHWINNSGFGGDFFFTVETSTPPGYFLPRRIASGEGDLDDLIFSFSIPRSADPVAVFESMANAVEYAHQRLGGEIILGSGEPFDKATERNRIEDIVQKLKNSGFVPGQCVF